jgi:hypothetical protein
VLATSARGRAASSRRVISEDRTSARQQLSAICHLPGCRSYGRTRRPHCWFCSVNIRWCSAIGEEVMPQAVERSGAAAAIRRRSRRRSGRQENRRLAAPQEETDVGSAPAACPSARSLPLSEMSAKGRRRLPSPSATSLSTHDALDHHGRDAREYGLGHWGRQHSANRARLWRLPSRLDVATAEHIPELPWPLI